MERYLVQTRKVHGKWTTRYSLEGESQAIFYYRCLNTFGKYRKRLVHPDGNVLVRQAW